MLHVWPTSCVRSCITSTLDKHHSTCQTVYPKSQQSVADTSWGRLAQLITFCREQELDLENEVSPTVAQPPGTLFLPTSTTLLTPVHSENDSRVYFMIVLTTDYCWRSWACRIAAPYKFHVDWLINAAYTSHVHDEIDDTDTMIQSPNSTHSNSNNTNNNVVITFACTCCSSKCSILRTRYADIISKN